MGEADGGLDKVAALEGWRGSNLFNEMERVALEYAERMTITGEKVDEALFARLRAQFDEVQIIELTACIAIENFRSKFNVPFQVEAQRFCIIKQAVGEDSAD